MAKILYIEDDLVSGKSFQKLFEDDYTVEFIQNGDAAIDRARNSSFDLFIIDINLGANSINGLEVLRQLREIVPPEKLHVIILSSYYIEKFMNDSLDLSDVIILNKPVDFRLLANSVKEILK